VYILHSELTRKEQLAENRGVVIEVGSTAITIRKYLGVRTEIECYLQSMQDYSMKVRMA